MIFKFQRWENVQIRIYMCYFVLGISKRLSKGWVYELGHRKRCKKDKVGYKSTFFFSIYKQASIALHIIYFQNIDK